MVSTIKFSEFTSGGDLSNNVTTVGLDNTLTINTRFNNPWTFLPPGTTGDRPVPSAAIDFRLRLNTTLMVYEYYDPNVALWVQLSGTGTGTVNPGTVNDLAFYAATGTAISPIASNALSVLVTNAGSVPSLSTTLPTGLSIPGATITASTAALTAGSVIAAPVAGSDITNKTYVDGLFASGVDSITGTTNQVIASSPTGNVTLSLPQDIALGSTPTFGGLTLTSIPLGVSSGGSGRNTLTIHDLIIGNGTTAVTLLAPSATSGIPLVSQGAAADPAYSTAVVAGGGTGNTTFTAYSVITAGTTATGAFQNVVGVGSANQVLTSNGAGFLPTWQAVSASGAIESINGDAGSVTPTAGVVTISGGITGLTTSGAVSTLTLTGTLKLANGGTNASLTASNGGIFYSTATAGAILSGTATAGQHLQSGASSAPSWTTATFPATATGTGTILRADGTNWVASTATFANTYTASNLLYSNGANTVTGLATANNGLLVTSSAGVPSILAGPGTTGNILQSNAAAAPSFSTATYPSVATSSGTILRANGTNWVASTSTFADTYSASTLLYSNGANTVTGLATANSAVLVTNSSGVPAWSGTMTNGQLIIGSTTATPTAATLTAGSGITITNGAASITIASTTSGLTWTTVSGTTQSAAVNNGYVTNNAGAVTVTLPTTFAVGDVVTVKGLGAGGWILAAGTATTIREGSSVTSSAGSLASTNQYDTVKVTGLVANTTWSVDYAFSGGLTVA